MARTVVALMLREIATTYGRSPGGYVWALADPILGIALLTLVFQHAMGNTNPLRAVPIRSKRGPKPKAQKAADNDDKDTANE